MKRVWIGLALSLTACSVTQPVAVIGQHGDVLVGTTTASLLGGTFDVANGPLSCHGTYNALLADQAVHFGTRCTDGRQGGGVAVRDSTMEAGSGSVSLSDGEVARFVFGPEAAIFTPAVGR